MTRDEKLALLDSTISMIRRKILPPGSVDEESRQVLIQSATDKLNQLFDSLEALEAAGEIRPEDWESEWLRRSELVILPFKIYGQAAVGEYRPYDEIEYWHSVAIKTIASHLGYPETVIEGIYEKSPAKGMVDAFIRGLDSMEMIPGGNWEGYRMLRSENYDLLDMGRFYVGQQLNTFLVSSGVVDVIKREVEKRENPRAIFGAVIYQWMLDLAMALDSQVPPSEAEKILNTTLERLNQIVENSWEPAVRHIQNLSGPDYERAMSELMISIQHELNGLERGAWEQARQLREQGGVFVVTPEMIPDLKETIRAEVLRRQAGLWEKWGIMRPWWSQSPMWQSFISLFWGTWLMKSGIRAISSLARSTHNAIEAARKWSETTSALARWLQEATGQPVRVTTSQFGTVVSIASPSGESMARWLIEPAKAAMSTGTWLAKAAGYGLAGLSTASGAVFVADAVVRSKFLWDSAMRILWSDDMDAMIESAVSKLVGKSYHSYSDFQNEIEPIVETILSELSVVAERVAERTGGRTPVTGTLKAGGELGLATSPDGPIEIDYRWISEIMSYFKMRLESMKDDIVLALADVTGFPEEWKEKIAQIAIDEALAQVNKDLQSYIGLRTTPSAVMEWRSRMIQEWQPETTGMTRSPLSLNALIARALDIATQKRIPVTSQDKVVIKGKEFIAKYSASVIQFLWDNAMRFIDQEAVKLQAEYPLPQETQSDLIRQTKDAFWSEGFQSFLNWMNENLAFDVPVYLTYLKDWLEKNTFISMHEIWRETFLGAQSPIPVPTKVAEIQTGGEK